MCLDVGAIDCGGVHKHSFGHQGLEDAKPKSVPGPAVEAVVDGGVRPVILGAITPPAACLEDVQNAADDPSIIDPSCPRLVHRQMRFDRHPRGI